MNCKRWQQISKLSMSSLIVEGWGGGVKRQSNNKEEYEYSVMKSELLISFLISSSGNPGVPHFYEDFMQKLYLNSRGQIPVWTLSHAGHTQPPGETLSLSDVCKQSLCSVNVLCFITVCKHVLWCRSSECIFTIPIYRV